MNWQLKQFNELSAFEIYKILQLREEVFIIEQNCIYQDIEDTDLIAHHLFAIKNDVCIAYARLIPPGIKYKDCSIGRVVVKKSERLNAFGKELMKQAITSLKNLFPNQSITISAQLYLKNFYQDFGFEAIGEPYMEDDIPHIKMTLAG